MTLKIEVTIPEDEIRSDSASTYLARAMSAIGFTRPPKVDWKVALGAEEPGEQPLSRDAEVLPDEGSNYAAMKAAHDAALPPAARAADATAAAPKRERGKPSPGRARRTKEEIAEDEAAEAAEKVWAASHAVDKIEEAKANISTGDERIDPTSPEDAAQDATDEAAEAEATKVPELTHDDVRAALKKYLDAYGTPAAMEDGPKVLTLAAGKPTAKVSDMATDQETLAKAIAGIEEMLTKNPFKREAQL